MMTLNTLELTPSTYREVIAGLPVAEVKALKSAAGKRRRGALRVANHHSNLSQGNVKIYVQACADFDFLTKICDVAAARL
jgi:hypothetical protein